MLKNNSAPPIEQSMVNEDICRVEKRERKRKIETHVQQSHSDDWRRCWCWQQQSEHIVNAIELFFSLSQILSFLFIHSFIHSLSVWQAGGRWCCHCLSVCFLVLSPNRALSRSVYPFLSAVWCRTVQCCLHAEAVHWNDGSVLLFGCCTEGNANCRQMLLPTGWWQKLCSACRRFFYYFLLFSLSAAEFEHF